MRDGCVGSRTLRGWAYPHVLGCSTALTLPVNSVETARLLLRVPELADAEALMGIMWDPEVVEQKQVTLREPPGGLDLALKNTNNMVRQWELRGYGQWSVIEKLTGHVIGCVGFYHPQG